MNFKSPRYNEDGTIDVEVEHPQHGWIPFTASPDDPEDHGRAIFEDLRDKAEPYKPLQSETSTDQEVVHGDPTEPA